MTLAVGRDARQLAARACAARDDVARRRAANARKRPAVGEMSMWAPTVGERAFDDAEGTPAR